MVVLRLEIYIPLNNIDMVPTFAALLTGFGTQLGSDQL
jgi:hypothetical protein